MRKILILAVIIFFALGLFYLRFSPKTEIKLPQTSDTITPTPGSELRDSLPAGYKVVWLEVIDKDKLFLYSNLAEPLTAKDFATKNSCAHIVSGGFYSLEGKHIGLFVSEGETLSQSQENSLFNGYFSLSREGLASITDYPVFSPRISLQTGPILMTDGTETSLSLKSDENARRLAVGISEENAVFFFVIYDAASPLLGPTLEELPGILADFVKDKKLDLTYILNLDGGAHSAFITDFVSLSEASPAGSFFCVKP